jgi:hypothetical protein
MDLTPEELDAQLSNNYRGSAYNGDDDIYLSYIGGTDAKNLIDMEKSNRRLSFQIINATTSRKVIAINPASYPVNSAAAVYLDTTLKYIHPNGKGVLAAPAGYIEKDIISMFNSVLEIKAAGNGNVDAVLDDGVIYAEAADPTKRITVTATNPESSVKHFMKHSRTSPTAFVGMHITSDDSTMFETELVSKRITPYGNEREVKIPFQDFADPKNPNTGKIIVKAGFQIDPETLVLLTVPAGATITVSMIAGAIESNGVALARKIEGAKTGTLVAPAVKPMSKVLPPKFVPKK